MLTASDKAATVKRLQAIYTSARKKSNDWQKSRHSTLQQRFAVAVAVAKINGIDQCQKCRWIVLLAQGALGCDEHDRSLLFLLAAPCDRLCLRLTVGCSEMRYASQSKAEL